MWIQCLAIRSARLALDIWSGRSHVNIRDCRWVDEAGGMFGESRISPAGLSAGECSLSDVVMCFARLGPVSGADGLLALGDHYVGTRRESLWVRLGLVGWILILTR